MTTVKCPHCGTELDLCDTMDANPPIPYTSWPDRWGVSRDELGIAHGEYECSCGEWLDPTELAVAAGLPSDYPSWLAEPRNRAQAARRAATR